MQSETVKGIAELATDAEVASGADTTRIVTSETLRNNYQTTEQYYDFPDTALDPHVDTAETITIKAPEGSMHIESISGLISPIISGSGAGQAVIQIRVQVFSNFGAISGGPSSTNSSIPPISATLISAFSTNTWSGFSLDSDDYIQLTITRKGGSASDTSPVDLKIYGITVNWTAS